MNLYQLPADHSVNRDLGYGNCVKISEWPLPGTVTALAKMDAILLRKIEELTLYIIELEKKLNEK